MNYELKTKTPQGWRTVGNLKTNKWGNLTVGLKRNEFLNALFNGTADGGWFNLACFEQKSEKMNKEETENLLNDSVPF